MKAAKETEKTAELKSTAEELSDALSHQMSLLAAEEEHSKSAEVAALVDQLAQAERHADFLPFIYLFKVSLVSQLLEI